jgi:hypothetical protein
MKTENRIDDSRHFFHRRKEIASRVHEGGCVLPLRLSHLFLSTKLLFLPTALPVPCNTLAKMPKATGSPRIIVVAGAALRVADLCRCVLPFHCLAFQRKKTLTNNREQGDEGFQDENEGWVDRRRKAVCEGSSPLSLHSIPRPPPVSCPLSLALSFFN